MNRTTERFTCCIYFMLAAAVTWGCQSASSTNTDAAASVDTTAATNDAASASGGSTFDAAGTGGTGTGGTSSGGASVPAATGGQGGATVATGGTAGKAGTGGATAGAGGVVTMPGTGGAAGRAGTGGAATGGGAGMSVATGGAGTGGSAGHGGAPGTGGAAGAGGVTAPMTTAALYVVAHPSDELLFMNPDLEADVQGSAAVTTVYVTSGDGGDLTSDWKGHEQKVMAAYAAMANAANTWTCGAATYAGKSTVRCTLAARPAVRSIFLRLIDGGPDTLRRASAGTTVATADATGTYTSAQLAATVTAIQTEVNPARVGALDGTLAHGPEHSDHIAAGIMTFDVARSDGKARQLTMYRGYTMWEPSFITPPVPAAEAANLTTAQYTEKLRIIMAYQAPPLDAGFDEWCHRFYPITSVAGAAGTLKNAGGQCLSASGTGDGAAVGVAACATTTAQTWTVAATGRVTGPSSRCLALASDGIAAVIKTCSTTALDQRWTLMSDGQLRGTGNTCLTVSGTSVTAAGCGPDMSTNHFTPPASQRWTR